MRRIESTAARLEDIFFVDPRAELIERRDPEEPGTFFESAGSGNLQRHRFSFGDDDVLRLSGPFVVEVELREAGGAQAQTALGLSGPGGWTFTSGGKEEPFTSAAVRGDVIELTYTGDRAVEAGENGRYGVAYQGSAAGERLVIDAIRLKSRPVERVPVDSAANGDVTLDLEAGDYCLGRRPGAYSMCYLRSDAAFSKLTARVAVELDIAPVVTEAPADTSPQYQFNQRIIDKKSAVTVTPDDVFVGQVIWEYYNGFGWRTLKVSGDKNPFSCKREGRLELTFDVPEDMCPVEVNAEEGYHIRARVVYVENEFSPVPRRLAPFLKGAWCTWSYASGVPARWCEAENNGDTEAMEDIEDVTALGLTVLTGVEDHPAAMYMRFEGSPHAMPLAVYFDMAGSARLEDKLRVEAWTGERFESVRWVDLTRNLQHSGVAAIYLPGELPERRLFGESGRWLRILRSSYAPMPGRGPLVRGVKLNIVEAVQREQAGVERYSTQGYEPGKTVKLLRTPVLDSEVWVDEAGELPVAEAQRLQKLNGDAVRLEWDDRVMAHCWVRWERVSALGLCGPADRRYELDPYEGTVTFGDGVHGRVPPVGLDVIAVRYCQGGGELGNAPAGAVNNAIGALPRISAIENITAMSGGTDRLPLQRTDAIGTKRLRNRDRAASARDFEEIVTLRFPQVKHVRCFPRADARGAYAPGHVCVVVESGETEQSHSSGDLCQRVMETLADRCDCVMLAEGRLHVVRCTVLTVSSTVQVEMDDPDLGAVTQQEIARRLTELIDGRWKEREIGSQLRINEVWQTVRDTPNVRLIRNILLEGRYWRGGVERLIPLENDGVLPYVTVRSGEHLVQMV